MAFRPSIARLLAAERFEQHRRALDTDARHLREAVQEVRARRDLLYPPLNRTSKEKHG